MQADRAQHLSHMCCTWAAQEWKLESGAPTEEKLVIFVPREKETGYEYSYSLAEASATMGFTYYIYNIGYFTSSYKHYLMCTSKAYE